MKKAAASTPSAPIQARAMRTREKLLTALEDLLRTSSFPSIAVTDIAKTAGVSVGSVYSHFADKDAFLVALLQLWRERINARLAEIQRADLHAEYHAYGGLYETIKAVTVIGFDQISADAHIVRATNEYLRGADAKKWKPWDALRLQAFETITPIIDIYADEITIKDLDTAKHMFNYFLNVSLAERIIYGERGVYGAMALSDDDFITATANMAYAYLTAPR